VLVQSPFNFTQLYAKPADFDLAVQLMVQDDLVALQRLVDSGRVGLLRAGIAVQVMETSG